MMSYELGALGSNQFVSSITDGSREPAGPVRYWEVGEYRSLLQSLESFLKTVLETDQVPFEILYQSWNAYAVRNPVGVSGYKSLVGFMPQCAQWMDLCWPDYAYSADLQLFFDCFMRHQYSRLFSNGTLMGHVDRVTAAKLYNDFVGCLRAEAVRQGVRKKLADARANLGDQAKSIGCYLGELTSQFGSLVPIRLDLGYAEDAFDASDAMSRMSWSLSSGVGWKMVPSCVPVSHGRQETRARIDTRSATADRDSFFANRRGADKHLFERMVGHVCKQEQGGKNGVNHFHCVFLFDASGLKKADVPALRYGLGDRWRRVTRGQGLVFDCHDEAYRRSIESHVQWAIDRLDCSDGGQVTRFVDYVVGYFAKDDGQMVRVKPTAKAQTLTKGR
ncbi:inovirus-type Gp2 protein [Paraburkholderia sp. ZP32-5]|uniref:inovirus-type Gp2 protein n=1 Tax=Paraburkholderia sp. ZP32-5 TaxID=2883245 RepID=UPI001F2C00CA|nr:inovirus-type Gp2 protein [Paraburkholderia sp. ZP32-5]